MVQIHRLVAAAGVALLIGCTTPIQKSTTVANGPLVKGVSYVGLAVSDLDRSEKFYVDAAGYAEVDRSNLNGNSALGRLTGSPKPIVKTRLLRGGNGQMRLMQFDKRSAAAQASTPVPVQGPGITHICHQSPMAKPLYPRFIVGGAKPVSRGGQPIRLVPEVPVRYAYARDADGIMFENEIIETDPPPPFDHRMGHVALATIDLEKTVSFYSALLGRPPRERRYNLARPTLDQAADLNDVKVSVAWYTIGNLELEIWQYLNPVPTPPSGPRPVDAYGYNMIVLDVADAQQAGKLLEAAGGKLEGRSVKMDQGEMVFGRDPDGNLIGLLSTPAASVFSSSSFKSR